MFGQDGVSLSKEVKDLLRLDRFVAKVARHIADNPVCKSFHKKMIQCLALGDVVGAKMYRDSIVRMMLFAGKRANLILTVVSIGWLLSEKASGMPISDNVLNMEQAQYAYKQYVAKVDFIYFNYSVGGVKIGPSVEPLKMTFAQFLSARYPKTPVPSQEIILKLEW